jgi:hypothetical protein
MPKLTYKEIEQEAKRIKEEYAHMDNMLLEQWMWEIIRRSKDYHVFYEKWHQQINKPANERNDADRALWKEYVEKYDPIFPKHPDSNLEWPAILINQKRTKLRPVLTANLALGFGIDAQRGEPIKGRHPDIVKMKREFEPGEYIVFEKGLGPAPYDLEWDNKTTYVVDDYPPLGPGKWSEQPDGKMVWFRNYPLIDHPIEILYEHQGMESVVMALIDLSASESIDNILKSLKQELLNWKQILKLSNKRSAKTPKKKPNKLIKNARIWKSYLIVYDLVTSGKSLKIVSEILSLIDDFYSDVKNVENHYKNALALINGGYREYMQSVK